MKVCPVCFVSFTAHKLKVYCSDKCARRAEYERLDQSMTYEKRVLLNEVRRYGKFSIPQRADAGFLTDLLFALQVTRK